MRFIFIYELLRLLRDKVMLVWTLGLPLILTFVFMGMFANLDGEATLDPLPIGVVEDAAYLAAPGLDAVVTQMDDAESSYHFANVTVFESAEDADGAARAGDTVGYLVVEDGVPVLRLTAEGNESMTSLALRNVMTAYSQSAAQQRELIEAGLGGPELAARSQQLVFTDEVQVTPTSTGTTTRYYFSLLAFTGGMGMMIAMLAVQGVMASSGALGARRTMAAVPRWRVLGGTLLASWVAVTSCMIIAFAVMRFAAGVEFGQHWYLAVVAIAISGLMFSSAGAALGTFPKLQIGIVSGFSTLLSLFTGLYGTGSQQLADKIERSIPWLAQINPLWQSTHAFYSLLYYDSHAPFLSNCAAMAGMTVVFMAVAVVRMRRMSHEHL